MEKTSKLQLGLFLVSLSIFIWKNLGHKTYFEAVKPMFTKCISPPHANLASMLSKNSSNTCLQLCTYLLPWCSLYPYLISIFYCSYIVLSNIQSLSRITLSFCGFLVNLIHVIFPPSFSSSFTYTAELTSRVLRSASVLICNKGLVRFYDTLRGEPNRIWACRVSNNSEKHTLLIYSIISIHFCTWTK